MAKCLLGLEDAGGAGSGEHTDPRGTMARGCFGHGIAKTVLVQCQLGEPVVPAVVGSQGAPHRMGIQAVDHPDIGRQVGGLEVART